MQNYTCNTLAVVAVVCSTCPLPPAFGEAGESQVQLAPAGTVGIPKGVYAFLFSPTNRVAASEHYRPFLVLAPEESPQEVVEQIRNTKPVAASSPYRVRMPEWPESIEFVDEIEAAKAVQRVMQTDRWTDLKEVFYRFRDLKADKDFSLEVHVSFHKLRQDDWVNVKIYDSAATNKSLSMTFYGSDRRLSTFSASNGSNQVVIELYDNGVPFILHSTGDAGVVVGWQLRWLPNGEVARAIYLKEPWTPPTETPRNGGKSSPWSDQTKQPRPKFGGIPGTKIPDQVAPGGSGPEVPTDPNVRD